MTTSECYFSIIRFKGEWRVGSTHAVGKALAEEGITLEHDTLEAALAVVPACVDLFDREFLDRHAGPVKKKKKTPRPEPEKPESSDVDLDWL